MPEPTPITTPQSSRTRRATAAAAIAVAIAAPAEGLRHYVYADPVGIPTYCFGETKDVENRFHSTEECMELLNLHMVDAVDAVERCVPGLPPQVLGAFASAVYNVGPKIACDLVGSTAARYLHDGKLIDACNQLPRWNRAAGFVLPGLTKRRAVEQVACLKGLA